MATEDKILVSRDALFQVLSAIIGAPHLIGELIVIHDLGAKGLVLGGGDPVGTLIAEYNAAVSAQVFKEKPDTKGE